MTDQIARASAIILHIENLADHARETRGKSEALLLRAAVVDAIRHRGLTPAFAAEITGLDPAVVAAWVQHYEDD
ncbi:hypothetical protein [Georgenia yuyongxinii]|uniref:Helix-turn-helix domain-containing protein n=1 Tax=Georgenia yuyongxinii TaxID=2589797 RepID=A0A552WUF1_9MICO|nr:hypothetical protein [Georgenia yuyongxinii]TRW46377.1 hypothetical protein FJ693_05475 [Georgenia yuyongxinii]